MRLINWHWLEDLLVRACEAEVRAFARRHQDEEFFAFCLEFEGLSGELAFSYGTRGVVEDAYATLAADPDEEPLYYRAVELNPEHWRYRREPVRDEDGSWARARPILAAYAEAMQEDPESEVGEFLWLRFEYLAESVIRRLVERDGFRALPREAQFLAYPAAEDERLEELEERILKLYPNYRRATAELVDHPRPGELSSENCEAEGCPNAASRPEIADLTTVLTQEELRHTLTVLDHWREELGLQRCTYCDAWLCEACGEQHAHPELARRQSFFRS